MYKKILVFICCVVLVSKTLKSQFVSVEGVWHADTVQCAAPFYLHAVYLVNTGNLPIYENQFKIVIATRPVSQINSPPFIANKLPIVNYKDKFLKLLSDNESDELDIISYNRWLKKVE